MKSALKDFKKVNIHTKPTGNSHQRRKHRRKFRVFKELATIAAKQMDDILLEALTK